MLEGFNLIITVRLQQATCTDTIWTRQLQPSLNLACAPTIAGLAPTASSVLAMKSCWKTPSIDAFQHSCMCMSPCEGALQVKLPICMGNGKQHVLTIDTKLVIHCIRGLLFLTAWQSCHTESAFVLSCMSPQTRRLCVCANSQLLTSGPRG